jgi:hypothetical protein
LLVGLRSWRLPWRGLLGGCGTRQACGAEQPGATDATSHDAKAVIHVVMDLSPASLSRGLGLGCSTPYGLCSKGGIAAIA